MDNVTATQERNRKRWTAPRVAFVGHIGDVLKGGEGKCSPVGGDPGEMKVQKSGEPCPAG